MAIDFRIGESRDLGLHLTTCWPGQTLLANEGLSAEQAADALSFVTGDMFVAIWMTRPRRA